MAKYPKKTITKDYPEDGSYNVTFWTKEGYMFGAFIEKENKKWIYTEFDDHVSGHSAKKFSKKLQALRYLRKRLPKIKQKAIDMELEE